MGSVAGAGPPGTGARDGLGVGGAEGSPHRGGIPGRPAGHTLRELARVGRRESSAVKDELIHAAPRAVRSFPRGSRARRRPGRMGEGRSSVEVAHVWRAEAVPSVEGNASWRGLARAGRAPRRRRAQPAVYEGGWGLGGLRVVPAGGRRDCEGRDGSHHWRCTARRSKARPQQRPVPGSRRREPLRTVRSEGPGPTRIREAEARFARWGG